MYNLQPKKLKTFYKIYSLQTEYITGAPQKKSCFILTFKKFTINTHKKFIHD